MPIIVNGKERNLLRLSSFIDENIAPALSLSSIKILKKKYGINAIFFVDDEFFIDKNYNDDIEKLE